MKKDKIKFSFTPDFQLEILRFIIQDKEGGLVLGRLKPSYLVLIEHSLICEGILKYFKKTKKIPSQNVLKEVIKEMLESKAYVDLVTKDDIPTIERTIKNLYSIQLSDSEYIKEKIYKYRFAAAGDAACPCGSLSPAKIVKTACKPSLSEAGGAPFAAGRKRRAFRQIEWRAASFGI